MLSVYPRLVDECLNAKPETASLFDQIISSGHAVVGGDVLVNEHFNPMIKWIYDKISDSVNADTLDAEQVRLFIGEISIFARYNSTFLLRTADTVRTFCPELAQELTRNLLEEGGERGKLPAHYVIFTGALIKDLAFRVNGWMPRARATQTLLSLIDILARIIHVIQYKSRIRQSIFILSKTNAIFKIDSYRIVLFCRASWNENYF